MGTKVEPVEQREKSESRMWQEKKQRRGDETVEENKERRPGRRRRVKSQHNSFISKDLDWEFSLRSLTPPLSCFCPSRPSTPPAETSVAYFSLLIPQNVTVLWLYSPHSANLEGTERGREREGERERAIMRWLFSASFHLHLWLHNICTLWTLLICRTFPVPKKKNPHRITKIFQVERIKQKVTWKHAWQLWATALLPADFGLINNKVWVMFFLSCFYSLTFWNQSKGMVCLLWPIVVEYDSTGQSVPCFCRYI